jgi:hypothetical protein
MAIYTTTTKIYLRQEFKKEHPDKKILDGKATYFTSDYVEWLERELNKLRSSEAEEIWIPVEWLERELNKLRSSEAEEIWIPLDGREIRFTGITKIDKRIINGPSIQKAADGRIYIFPDDPNELDGSELILITA